MAESSTTTPPPNPRPPQPPEHPAPTDPAGPTGLVIPQGPPWLGPVLHRTQLDVQWLLVASILLSAGVVFFGWRGLAGVCCTALSALGAYLLMGMVIRIVRPKHALDSSLYALIVGLLLGACLPTMRDATVPLLGGLLLGIAMPFVGRSHRLRLHPVPLVLLVIWILPVVMSGQESRSLEGPLSGEVEAVLRPDRVVVGDLKYHTAQAGTGSWWSHRRSAAHESDGRKPPDALGGKDPSALVLKECRTMLRRDGWLVLMLQSGELCRFDELLLGAAPGPLGGSSRALLILLGVYLMYRRMASWQSALAALAAALVTLLLMPLVVDGKLTVVFVRLLAQPAAVACVYPAYFLLASPLALLTLILAPMTAPMSLRGQVIYGLTIGATVVAATWAIASPQAAYLGLALASTLSRPLDVMKHSPFVG